MLDQALRLNPQRAGFLVYRRGLVYDQLGDAAAAVQDFVAALASPQLPVQLRGDVLLRLALYYNGKDNSQAIARLQELVTLPPEEVAAETLAHGLTLLGEMLYAETGDLDLYQENVQRAVAHLVDGLTLDRFLNVVYLRLALGDDASLAAAVRLAGQATQLQSSNPWPALARCRANLAVSELAEAARWCERALALDPKNHAAAFWLGIIYARQERWEEAVAQFELAVRLQPDLPAYRTQLEQARQQLH